MQGNLALNQHGEEQPSAQVPRMQSDREILLRYPWEMYASQPDSIKELLEPAVLKILLLKFLESPRGKQPLFETCSEYLQAQNDVRKVLLECWKLGSFDTLRHNAQFLALASTFSNNDNALIPPLNPTKHSVPEPESDCDLLPEEYGNDICDDEEGQSDHQKQLQAKNVNIFDGSFYKIAGDMWRITYTVDRNREIAEWLSTNDHRATHNAVASKRAPNTGNWFLLTGKFKKWAQPSRERIIWCPGIPGVGKTVMASLVVDYLRMFDEPKTFVGIVYFNYKLQAEQCGLTVFGCLARQLFEASQGTTVASAFETLYNRHEKRRSRPTEAEFREIISRVLEQYQQCFIVLDAFDEFLERYSDQNLEDLTSKLLLLGANTKLLITSRIVGEMETMFTEKLGALRQDIVAHDHDMTTYLLDRITKFNFAFDLPEGFVDRMVEEVLKAANGRFLMAELHMNLLTDQLNLGDLEEALHSLPDSIDKTYSNCMHRIQEYSQSRRELAIKALSWVAYARRCLSVQELQHALAAKPGRTATKKYATPISTITSLCAGLIVVLNDEHKEDRCLPDIPDQRLVQFVHFTAREFLVKRLPDLSPKPHQAIFQTCLTYISMSTNGLCQADFSSQRDRWCPLEKNYPFLHYAALSWGYHANSHSQSLSKEILLFLNNEQDNQCLDPLLSYTLDAGFPQEDAALDNSAPGVFLAIFHDQPQIALELLSNSTTIPMTRKGRNPVNFASCLGRTSAVKEILEWLSNNAKSRLGAPNNPPSSMYNLQEFINSHDEYRRSAISHAVGMGYEDVVRLLLQYDCTDADSKDTEGWTPLWYASEGGFESIVKILLDHGVNVNSRDKLERTSFLYAAQYGREAIVRLLLTDSAVDVDAKDCYGRTGFWYAARYGHKGVVTLLLEHGGVDVNLQDKEEGTALSYSARYGQESMLKLLLQHEAIDVNLTDSQGRTALSYAVQNGQATAVELLLEHGRVDANSPDKDGRSPFSYAAQYGRNTVMTLLREWGPVEVDVPDCRGRAPIWYAVHHDHLSTVALLLCCGGVDINRPDRYRRTPFSYAAQRGYHMIVRRLLDHDGVDVDARDEDGLTPFAHAVMEGRVAIARLLLEHSNVDVNSRDHSGRTPLSYAAMHARTVILKLLLDHGGVDVNSQDNKGRTSLSWATQCQAYPKRPSPKEFLGAIRLLLAHAEIDINLADNNGFSPTDYARKSGEDYQEVAKLLMESVGKASQ